MVHSWLLIALALAAVHGRVDLDHAERLAMAGVEEAVRIERAAGLDVPDHARAWEEEEEEADTAAEAAAGVWKDLKEAVLGKQDATSASREVANPSSCAVVFNSGTLLKAEEGAQIDQHDWIIRMNMASTAGFEKNVGSKTTHQIVHVGSDEKFFKNKDTSTAVLFPVTSLETGSAGQNLQARARANNLNMIMGDKSQADCQSFYGLDLDVDGNPPCREPGKPGMRAEGCICSSGGYAILWAMSRCKAVDVFGYNQDPCYPFHYDQNIPAACAKSTQEVFEKVPDTGWHNFAQEKVKMEKMRTAGELHIKS